MGMNSKRTEILFGLKSKVLCFRNGIDQYKGKEVSGRVRQDVIVLQTNDISEKQLAQIALGIQNRWEVPTFVKMHEIVVMDDDLEGSAGRELLKEFETGVYEIFDYLEIIGAFRLHRLSKSKYSIDRVPGSSLPQWMEEIEKPPIIPEGTFVCPHCGRFFPTDIQLSLHQKIHYIV
jgi:hypothetical protein